MLNFIILLPINTNSKIGSLLSSCRGNNFLSVIEFPSSSSAGSVKESFSGISIISVSPLLKHIFSPISDFFDVSLIKLPCSNCVCSSCCLWSAKKHARSFSVKCSEGAFFTISAPIRRRLITCGFSIHTSKAFKKPQKSALVLFEWTFFHNTSSAILDEYWERYRGRLGTSLQNSCAVFHSAGISLFLCARWDCAPYQNNMAVAELKFWRARRCYLLDMLYYDTII